ncbi:5-(carboxyamino)imidazole ribonucleotide synthase [Mucisphaera sp.]|uniref:5-(carboxyamino)imidazole ribonucleotide synthase n=1 Tax=Mucisphaera sp. TaxID=2913024 RepID=UPI003D0F27E2
MTHTLLPGAALGVLGGGQLGRMLAQAAKRMGYRVLVYDPAENPPAAQVTDEHIRADWNDTQALTDFANRSDRVTLEWENIPLDTIRTVEAHQTVHPSSHILAIAQDRAREKAFLAAVGCPLPDIRVVQTPDDINAEPDWWNHRRVLKTAAAGYDGKGQIVTTTSAEALAAFSDLGNVPCVGEAWVPYEREVSVIIARTHDGQTALYGPIHNQHANHILDISTYPAGLNEVTQTHALELATSIANELQLVGVLCVELFVLEDGQLMVNELAPRPHNSGHLTIEACATSQFEQQVRTICGLPLGDPTFRSPAAMANLLGDLWSDRPPNWPAAAAQPGIALHIYGKAAARPGRKMGHLTTLCPTPDAAAQAVTQARSALLQD